MTSNPPLPPRLERFVRQQLASGRFHSENEVIRAALQLLEEHSPPPETSGTWRKPDLENRLCSKPSQFAGERRQADAVPGYGTPAQPAVRRSPRGILADLPSGISLDEIKEARSELWSGFPHGTAG